MNTKKCPKCMIDKVFPEDFSSEGKHCKTCHNKKAREWREKNREKYENSQKVECEKRKKKRLGKEKTVFDSEYFSSSAVFYIKRHRLRNVLWVIEYLKSHPCVDCNSTDILTLEFDHVRGEKEFNVGEMVQRGMSISKIEEEVSKCDVRCANCHTKKTAKERKYMSYLVLEDDFLNSEMGKQLMSPLNKIRVNKNSVHT